MENVDYKSVPIINDGKPDNISSIITEELSVIYIGRDTCKDCLRIEPEVRKMMEEKGIPYYRLNIIPEDGEAEEGYWIDRSIVVGLGIKEVPAFLVLHNKKAQGLFEGDAAIKNLQTL